MDPGTFIAGAILPRFVVHGAVDRNARWRIGSLRATPTAIEWRSREAALDVPTASIATLEGGGTRLFPTATAFESSAILWTLDPDGSKVGTGIAWPRITLENFPLQLAACVTGVVRVRVMPLGDAARGDRASEDATFAFRRDAFLVARASAGATQRIGLDRMAGLAARRARRADGREALEWTLEYVEDDRVERLSFSSVERLPFLAQLLATLQGMRRNAPLLAGFEAEALGETAEQVAVMLYTGGATAASIEQLLGLTGEEVDEVFDELVQRGLATVVRVRRDIQLTPAGAKLVDAVMKRQMEPTP
jgi:hypothetical protein